MAITQSISTISEAGKRGVDTRDVFVSKQEAFQDDIVNMSSELNNLKTQINNEVDTVNEKSKIAQDSANLVSSIGNFKGDWEYKGYYAGDGVIYNNNLYACIQSHSSSLEPDINSEYWATILRGDFTGSFGRLNSPLLDLPLKNSLAMKTGVGSVIFTRSTTGTYIDRYGVMQTADIDEPRFEKDGLLIEGSSTNLHLQSAKILDSEYGKVSDAVITEDYTDIAGGTDASLLSSSVDGDNWFYVYRSNTLSVGDIYTTSVYVNTANISDDTTIRLIARTDVTNSTSNSYVGVYKDGTEYFYDSDGVILNYKVENIKDTWYRIQLTTTVGDVNGDGSDVTSIGYFSLYIYGETILGDGVVFCYPQIEKLPFATSYIPTTDSEVTRSSDFCYLDGINNMPKKFDDYTISVETKIYEGICPDDISYRRRVLYLRNTKNTVSNWKMYYDRTYATEVSLVFYFSAARSNWVSNIKVGDSNRHTIVSYNGLGDVYNNGVKNRDTIVQEESDGYEEICDRIYIGSGDTARQLYGHIKNLKIYDTALTEEEVKLL